MDKFDKTIDTLADGIINSINTKIKEARYDKASLATVLEKISDKKYKVMFEGAEFSALSLIPQTLKIDDRVLVLKCKNINTAAYIIGVSNPEKAVVWEGWN